MYLQSVSGMGDDNRLVPLAPLAPGKRSKWGKWDRGLIGPHSARNLHVHADVRAEPRRFGASSAGGASAEKR